MSSLFQMKNDTFGLEIVRWSCDLTLLIVAFQTENQPKNLTIVFSYIFDDACIT